MATAWGGNAELDKIQAALVTEDPRETLHDLYPWVSANRIDRYVTEAIPLQNVGEHDALELAARRFWHDVDATRPPIERPTRQSVLRRIAALIKRKGRS